MITDQENLYDKYMAFNDIMLEDHGPLDVAAILVVQGLSFYRTFLEEEDYQKMVESIYQSKDDVSTFEGPDL